MQKIRKMLSLASLVFTGCSVAVSSNPPPPPTPNNRLENLTFECKHEVRPPLSPETQQLYNYAYYHDLHRLWTGNAGDWNDLAKYYRIATANGNYKANGRLQYLLYSNRITSENNKKEVIELNEQLEKNLPATAYFGYYFYLSRGYGLKTISFGEFAYLRKAADMGSRSAQYIIAKLLQQVKDKDSFELREKTWIKLFKCASEQGEKNASKSLAIDYKIDKKYEDAVRAFHQGVKNGDSMSTRFLMKSFGKNVLPRNDLKLSIDLERSKRYEMIEEYLSRNEYLEPKVPDLDDIVPLPPAKLPPWDGKIAFQRWYEGPSPAKPSDELMQKLAEKAGLDWQTGLPLKK